MDRLHLEFPDRAKPDAVTDEEEILLKLGLRHEKAILAKLKEAGRDVFEVPNYGDRVKSTLDAMRAGREILYQARLEDGSFAGYADFLEKMPGKSRIGAHHYTVSDTKLARLPQPHFILQLCCYADMLERLQGIRPEQISVTLRDGSSVAFRTDDFFFYYLHLKRTFLEFIGSFDPDKPRLPEGSGDFGRWQSYADNLLEKVDHLSRVAGVTKSQIQKLEAVGISTLAALAGTSEKRISKLADKTFARIREQAELQLRSRGEAAPKFSVVKPDPADPRKGLALLPPASENDIFFDMEGYPHVQGGLEYLFGATYLEGSGAKYRDWWGHSEQEERAAFEGFIDWAYQRWRSDRSLHIYHYGQYEVSAARRLMGRYATREDQVDDLLRNEVFVDLYAIVRNGFRIGTPSYSIKDVELLYRGKRTGDVKAAAASIVYYQRWLDSNEGKDYTSSPLLQSIRDYNKDDCESTCQLAGWLRAQQSKAQIGWIPKPVAESKETEKPKRPGKPEAEARRELAESQLALIPKDEAQRSAESERWRVHELLAYLLEFHRREEKPVWWAMYDRAGKTEEELVEDLDCLGGLTRENVKPVPIKQSWGYWYKFDPDQDTKLEQGDTCRFACDTGVTAEIHELDVEHGRICIKLGKTALSKLPEQIPPERLSLIPKEDVPTEVLEKSVWECVLAWRETGRLRSCLEDFVFRRPPRAIGHHGGALAADSESASDAALRLIPALDQSAICVQGPPGAGKTYTGAKVILKLLAENKRVAIAASSHKAILNLMRTCSELSSGSVQGVKIGGDATESFFQEHPNIRHLKSIKDMASTHRLVGGTAWALAADEARDGFDYLFVDEAGQVSLANLVAMSRCAGNLVLMGDQMQLGQPVKGTHPGQSGQSILDYYLQGKATIVSVL